MSFLEPFLDLSENVFMGYGLVLCTHMACIHSNSSIVEVVQTIKEGNSVMNRFGVNLSTDPNSNHRRKDGIMLPKLTSVLSVLVLYAFVVSVGCATVFTGTTKEISINSHPSNAKVEVRTGSAVVSQGHTPMSVKLRKGKDYSVTISIDGYHAETVPIPKGGLSKAVYLNIFNAYFLGWAIDYLSGAMFKIEETVINVSLQESKALDGTTNVYAVLTFTDQDGKQKSISTKMDPVKSFD